MKKLLTTLAALLALVLAAYGIASLRWRPGTRAGPPRLERAVAGTGELSAGVASLPLPIRPGLPIGGFARLSFTSSGVRDAVQARALVLSEQGASIALVSLDLLLVPPSLARAVEQKVSDLGLDHVVVAATHTHAGPGGYWHDAIAERAALGPYDGTFADDVAKRAADAVRAAATSRVPATLSAGVADAQRLARSRGHGAVDGRLVVLRVAGRDGAGIAEVVVFPAHATLLGKDNDLLSADWPGALARAAKVPLLFFQGALGDQSAKTPHGANVVERYGRRVGMAADAVKGSPPDPAPQLGAARVTAMLPAPDLGASPPFLRRVARNLLYGWFPDRAHVAALRLGPVTFLAVPAEPVADVGRRWRERAGEGAEILALANDYLGYVETQERMAEREGETVRTYYGPELDERLGEAVALATEALDGKIAAVASERAASERAHAEAVVAEDRARAAQPGMLGPPLPPEIGPPAPTDQNRTAGAPLSVKER